MPQKNETPENADAWFIDVLKRCPNARFQPLLQAITRIDKKKNGDSVVAFLTREMSPSDLINEPRNIGVVVWIPSAECDAAMKLVKAKEAK